METLIRNYIASSTLVLALIAAGGTALIVIGVTSIRRVSLANEAERVHGVIQRSWTQQLQTRLDQSGLQVRALEFVAIGLTLGGLGAGLCLLAGLLTLGALALLAGPLLYYQFLMRRRDQQLRLFREQLPDAIEDFSEYFQIYRTLDSVLREMAQKGPALLRPHFEAVVSHTIQGRVPMHTALQRIGRSRAEPFFRQFMDALANYEAKGGQLEPVLTRIAKSQRNQLALHTQIRSAQSGGRLVGMVYGIAPALFLLLMKLAGGPLFASYYASLLGQIVQLVAVLSGAIAYYGVLAVGRRGIYLDDSVSMTLSVNEDQP